MSCNGILFPLPRAALQEWVYSSVPLQKHLVGYKGVGLLAALGS